MTIKKTSKISFTIIVLTSLLYAEPSKAQLIQHNLKSGWRFGIGVESCIPTGIMRDISHSEVAGTARLQYNLKGAASLMLTSGYYNFFPRGYIPRPNYAIVPIKAGVKVFLVSGGYISGEVGAGFETKRYYGNHTKLLLSPAIGYAWSKPGIDISLRYENFSGQHFNYGMVALRAGYNF